MPTLCDAPTISLPQAAARLGASYGRTLNLLLCGQLHGTQAPNGRWRLDRESVDAFAAAHTAPRDAQ